MARYFYTYVLKSIKDSNFYIGWTDDLRLRVAKHNRGMVSSTRSRIPLGLVYFEACLSRDGAVRREKALKTGFGRKFLKNRLK